MTKRKYPGPVAKIGRVGAEQTFKPQVRKRRLVSVRTGEVGEHAEAVVQAGKWLRQLRVVEKSDVSLNAFAKLLGCSSAMLSMVELGTAHLPATKYERFAELVGIPPRDFVKKLLSFYAPEVYKVLLQDED